MIKRILRAFLISILIGPYAAFCVLIALLFVFKILSFIPGTVFWPVWVLVSAPLFVRIFYAQLFIVGRK